MTGKMGKAIRVWLGMIFVACTVHGVLAQTFGTHEYASDNSEFANPERGFYHHTETKAGSYSPLNSAELAGYRSEGISLILRVFYLELFVNSPVSESYLNRMEQDFAAARKAGVKIIVRFAYTQKTSAPYGDAAPARVLQHIAQLSAVLHRNSDVVAVVQAGFIGAWGEWYYTDTFSIHLGTVNEANWNDRRAVTLALLDAVPASRMVQLRTPQIKFNIAQGNTALTPAEAFTGSVRSRLAHHNDCFLASENDVGTYVNMEQEKAFLEEETKFLAMGGETCGTSVPLSECPNALAQMKRFHWSFLNRDYHPDVLTSWQAGGCIDDVSRQLGYRYRMTRSRLQQEGKPGGTVTFDFSIVNDGWANAYNPRDVEVVLKNSSTGKVYRLHTNADPRRWSLADTTKISVSAGLPAGIELASYSVYLNLSDPEVSLRHNPLYSVRLANAGAWEESSGFNNLDHILTVSANATVPVYTGSDFFFSEEDAAVSLTTPSELLSTVFGTNAILYWGLESDAPARVIQRSDNGGTYNTIAVLNGSLFTYTDRSLPAGPYTYRSYSTTEHSISPFTEPLQLSTKGTPPIFYTHRIDGETDDWESVPPLASAASPSETYTVRLFSNNDTLHVLKEGSGSQFFRVFLDTDNNSSTGIPRTEWSSGGFDFFVSTDSLFGAQAGHWIFAGKVPFVSSGRFAETAVPLSLLQNLQGNLLLRAAAEILFSGSANEYLPLSGQPPATYVRAQVPDPLNSFIVNPSSRAPETELIISWKACSGCLGYVLERSEGNANSFSKIATLTKNSFIYYDDDLNTGTTYFYRASSFNETGLSAYTTVLSGVPQAEIVLGAEAKDGLSVFPNPVYDHFTINSRTPLAVSVTDVQGRHVAIDEPLLVAEGMQYSARGMAAGVYVLKILKGGKVSFLRIIKR